MKQSRAGIQGSPFGFGVVLRCFHHGLLLRGSAAAWALQFPLCWGNAAMNTGVAADAVAANTVAVVAGVSALHPTHGWAVARAPSHTASPGLRSLRVAGDSGGARERARCCPRQLRRTHVRLGLLVLVLVLVLLVALLLLLVLSSHAPARSIALPLIHTSTATTMTTTTTAAAAATAASVTEHRRRGPCPRPHHRHGSLHHAHGAVWGRHTHRPRWCREHARVHRCRAQRHD